MSLGVAVLTFWSALCSLVHAWSCEPTQNRFRNLMNSSVKTTMAAKATNPITIAAGRENSLLTMCDMISSLNGGMIEICCWERFWWTVGKVVVEVRLRDAVLMWC